MHKQCFQCDLKQVKKISHLLSLNQTTEDLLFHKVQNYLDICDMNKTNPEILGEIWKIVSQTVKNDNPYKNIKSFYNQLIMNCVSKIEMFIKDDLNLALRCAIAGNLIDFSAKDNLTSDEVKDVLFHSSSLELAIDDSKQLFSQLEHSSLLLYIGDNCGEIVLDQMFIRLLKKKYPYLKVYYGVRGKPILNDVTMDDIREVGMDQVAHIIDNGDGSAGTVLSRVRPEFKELFDNADVVISKGQGNYEGLFDCKKENLYFLFMVKCQLVADLSRTQVSQIVCAHHNMDM